MDCSGSRYTAGMGLSGEGGGNLALSWSFEGFELRHYLGAFSLFGGTMGNIAAYFRLIKSITKNM